MKAILFTLVLAIGTFQTALAQHTVVAENNEPTDFNSRLTYRLKGNDIVTNDNGISFQENSAKILPSSNRTLNTIKKYLEDKPYLTKLRIEGHAEGYGNACQSLSESQALAVCAWLVANGISCERLIAVGFGDTKPVDFSSHAHLRQTRIVFTNAALRSQAIGGMPLDGGGKVAGDACQ